MKLLVGVLILVLSLLVFVACDDDDDEEASPTSAPATSAPAATEPADVDPVEDEVASEAAELCRTVDPDLQAACESEVASEIESGGSAFLCVNKDTRDWYLESEGEGATDIGDDCAQDGYVAEERVS